MQRGRKKYPDLEQLVDGSAATAGEARTLPLAIADGRASELAAIRGDAEPDRTATGADGIES